QLSNSMVPVRPDKDRAPRDTAVMQRATLHSPGPVLESSEWVRVQRMPPGDASDPRLVMVRAPDSPAAAAFRVLRHRLIERDGLRTVLVTSPRVGEGKTTCAVNLALALCEAGRARVLLLEANFRRPAIARMLGFRPPVCFSE